MKEDTKEVLEAMIDSISMQNDVIRILSNQIIALQKVIEDWDARAAAPTEIHNHYHNERQPLGPPTPIPVTPPYAPTYPWQFPIVSHGPWSVSTTDPNVTYTINNSFPKPDDDGREGIAVH